MVKQKLSVRLNRFRERWNDRAVSMLTIVLILMLFVFAPLQAIGIKLFQVLAFASALVLIGGAFLISGSSTVAIALIAAFAMAAWAAISRLSEPSILDVYLVAGAWLIMGIVLASVVARAVARSLCNLETILGQLYPATLLARLVSLEIEGRREVSQE